MHYAFYAYCFRFESHFADLRFVFFFTFFRLTFYVYGFMLG